MRDSDLRFSSDIILRYLLIFLVGISNLFILYFIFTPLTYETLYLITHIFSDAIIFSDGLMVNGIFFAIVSACVGGAAYYLLFILAMSTRGLNLLKRIKLILFLFIILFIFNILRILFMIYIYGAVYFTLIHWIFWYFISTLFVFIEWVLAVKIFNIQSIPIYSDILAVSKMIKTSKKSKKVHPIKSKRKKRK